MSVYGNLKRADNFRAEGNNRILILPRIERDVSKDEMLFARAGLPGAKDDLRYLEREQRFNEDELGKYIYFEPSTLASPYFPSLDGQVYDTRVDFGPDGMCPICNNAAAGEMNEFYFENLYDPGKWDRYPFTKEQVLKHIVQHVAVIYLRAADDRGIKAVRDGLARGDARRYTNNVEGDGTDPKRVTVAHEVSRVLSRIREDIMGRKAENSAVIELPPTSSLGVPFEPGYNDGTPMRPLGSDAKNWYAFDGGEQLGPLRPWGDKRVSTEIVARRGDALNLMDEMLDVRYMSRRIYSEIMDSDIDEANAEEERAAAEAGRKPRYIERNYSAAVAAVREIKSVVLEMSKLALIASRIGDEKGNVRHLSPTMQGLLDDIVGSSTAVDADVEVVGNDPRGSLSDDIFAGDDGADE